MIGNIDFARKAFKHRKLQPTLALIGLVICVASTTFMVLLGQGLGLLFTPSQANSSTNYLSGTVSRFIFFDSFLIFLVGMLNIYFLFSSMMADRKRDAGLIKALGSTSNLGFSYVMAEPLLIIICGCLLGCLTGSITFAVYSAVYLPYPFIPQGIIYILIIFGILIVSFVVSWFIAGREAEEMFKVAPINLFSGDTQNFDFVKEQLVGFRKFLNKLPWTFQLVAKSMINSRSKSKLAVICLMFSIVLMTVSLVGCVVAWSTTNSYVGNLYEQNIVAVGNTQVIDEYVALMTTNLNASTGVAQAFNFIEPQFCINASLINRLGSVQGVTAIDNRLLMFTTVKEVQTIEPITDQDGSPGYATYGHFPPRSSTALIVGVDPNHLIENLGQSTFWNSSNSDTTIVGTSLADTIFDVPLKQNIQIFSNNSSTNLVMPIANVLLDPLNQGFVVYAPLDAVQTLNSINGTNLVLVKIQNDSCIPEIESLAAQYGLTVVNLNNSRQQSLSNVDGIWLSILPFPLLSVITAMIGLLNCMFVLFSGRKPDFGILKAIGAKPNYTTKIVLLESFTLMLLAAPAGIAIGMLFNLIFLVPNPSISTQLSVASIGGLLLLLLSMCGLSTIIVLRINKQSPTNLMQETA